MGVFILSYLYIYLTGEGVLAVHVLVEIHGFLMPKPKIGNKWEGAQVQGKSSTSAVDFTSDTFYI